MEQRQLTQLKRNVHTDKRVIGVAAGSGLAAKSAENGGADFILALNSGKFRQMGVSSLAGWLPFSNANETVMDYGRREILPRVKNIPVFFGFNGTDPTIDKKEWLLSIKENGFAGINNFPTVGMFDGQFREWLDENNLSYDQEVASIKLAHELGLLTIAFVFDQTQTKQMLAAGADIICVHLGLTGGGTVGAKKILSLEAGKKIANELFDICEKVDPTVIRMIYGGPVDSPLDADYMFKQTTAHGYIGGSSFERTPVEDSIGQITNEFKTAGILESDKKLYQLLEELEQHYDYVDFTQKYIADHYMDDIKLTELADIMHISRQHLGTLFKEKMGITFSDYLTSYRLNQAITILENKTVSIGELAQMVGYTDASYFSRAFKKYTGFSPNSFRSSKNVVETEAVNSSN